MIKSITGVLLILCVVQDVVAMQQSLPKIESQNAISGSGYAISGHAKLKEDVNAFLEQIKKDSIALASDLKKHEHMFLESEAVFAKDTTVEQLNNIIFASREGTRALALKLGLNYNCPEIAYITNGTGDKQNLLALGFDYRPPEILGVSNGYSSPSNQYLNFLTGLLPGIIFKPANLSKCFWARFPKLTSYWISSESRGVTKRDIARWALVRRVQDMDFDVENSNLLEKALNSTGGYLK